VYELFYVYGTTGATFLPTFLHLAIGGFSPVLRLIQRASESASHKCPPQTGPRSVQPFLHSSRTRETDRMTDTTFRQTNAHITLREHGSQQSASRAYSMRPNNRNSKFQNYSEVGIDTFLKTNGSSSYTGLMPLPGTTFVRNLRRTVSAGSPNMSTSTHVPSFRSVRN